MAFAGMNYWAILIAAVAGWLTGAVWYAALFGQAWMKAQGKTMESCKAEQAGKGPMAANAPFVISFVAALVMAWVLAGVVGHLGAGQVTLQNGVISAAFLWAGFVVTSMATNYSFGGRTLMLFVIDAGHWLAGLVIMGAIIGAMGVK